MKNKKSEHDAKDQAEELVTDTIAEPKKSKKNKQVDEELPDPPKAKKIKPKKSEKKIAELDNPEEMVKVYIDQRMRYFREFMNLSKFRSTEPEQVKPLLKELFFRFRLEEQKLLVKILKIGNSSGQFHCENEELYADLFLNIVKGLRFSLIQQKPYIELAPEELEVLVNAFHDFTTLFIRGLKYNESKYYK